VALMQLLLGDGVAFASAVGVLVLLAAGVGKLWFLLRCAGSTSAAKAMDGRERPLRAGQ
jgi:hypothetical protein